MTNKINPVFLMRAQNSLVFQKARNKFIAGISISYKLGIFFDIPVILQYLLRLKMNTRLFIAETHTFI